ncbi:MBL fold metallo-hydrolase [Clostridium sp. 19966]|uniref:MBL fold metallo-hydrolase n=1 Tax=Clostridium sp. 19966 TaxID=2768166 RepID=UPI0028DFE329|nr:MBL fold metallo-hydrolase [Clostridium sp. 19966]MDT8718023.1 MBL fold metallo-hydrolase [Clostridium sp. 19966]
MKIKAVKLYENGFMTQDFAFGGSADKSTLDASKTYPSSLQNYVIDTGKEVILVDTGVPAETPEMPPKEGQKIYQGTKIKSYVEALKALGYAPEDVSKILLTHKHPDHSGELRSFPNAKIYLSPAEADALKLSGENIVRAEFKNGAYHNFESSEKIADGVYLISAPGHTKGNSIVIVEEDGVFYMLHGDVTYTDAALIENQLSVVFEDREAARETLNKVREFIKNNPTVYLSTHTPEGIANLEEKKIMKL